MEIKLMEFRKAAGFKNRDVFAEKIGVNKYTYRSWESGAAMMNAEQIWNCAVALNCTPNDLLGWYDEHPEDRPLSPPATAATDPMAADLVRHFSNLSEEGREVAVNVLAGMESTYPQGDGAPRLVEGEAV